MINSFHLSEVKIGRKRGYSNHMEAMTAVLPLRANFDKTFDKMATVNKSAKRQLYKPAANGSISREPKAKYVLIDLILSLTDNTT